MDNLINEFLNPTAEYRGKPFWSWNGKLEKEELIRQIHVIKEMGFGGFFMHSRTGLETEYLSDEWFELINACADEAEKLGIEAWLYDEDRWPSGIAGGMVTENPEFRMKSVKLEIFQNYNEINWEAEVIAAFACVLAGTSVYEYERINKDTPIEAMKDKQILVFYLIEMSRNSFYNGYTYVDTLNRKATDKFIELTHEKYKQKCGDRLGRSIKGIFTDEPHRGTLMDEFGAGNDSDIWRAPWTAMLPLEFKNMHGYDLVEKLPELFLKLDGNSISQVKWHYVELVQQMFLDNYAKPINEWCKNNNIILTGHILHEDSLTAQTAMSGSVMRYYEHMEYPGVDVLTEGNKAFWVAKQLSSVARQLGKKWLLSELYGCTGWQMDFEGHKAVGDWQALFGINLRCHHLSWYTMEGEAKRDYPASILHQSTWWREYKYVEDYFSRIGLLLSQGKPCCDVLVVNSVESVWSQVHPGWAKMLTAKAPEITKLEEQYQDLFHWLSGTHIDFDYGDEEMISRYYSIEQDLVGNPILKIGEASYKVVILGGMLTLRSSTLRLLEEFIQAGGKVVIAGDVPDYLDAIKSKLPQALLTEAVKVPFERESLISSVCKHLSFAIEVTDGDGKNIDDIYCQLREDDKNKYAMFLNINREKGYENVNIKINTQGNVEEWVCSSGERVGVMKSGIDGLVEFKTHFEAGKEHLYVIIPEASMQLQSKPIVLEKERYSLAGPYEYTLDEPNVCVLDMAKYSFDEGEWQEEQEILKVDQAVRSNYGLVYRGGEMLQPWFANKQKSNIKGRVSLKFEFYVDIVPEDHLQLVLERPENFEIYLNEQTIDNTRVNGWWIDQCFKKITLPVSFIKIGRNTVELKVDFNEGINLEAIYVIGRFGVKIEVNKNTLIKLPEKLFARDITKQGLPFYSGKIRYHLKISKKLKQGEKTVLSLEKFEAACIKVISVNKEEKMIAWKPYETDITNDLNLNQELTIELVLTRRNTFGPLHQLPVRASAYGPYSFVTEGDEFSNDYILIRSGLLKEPVVKILV
ncbi:MAG TPA: glycosyl hydrolase [Ruminiclostridium sp.]